MKLTYLHVSPMPGPGANTIQVAKMCEAFGRAGASTHLVTPRARLGRPHCGKVFEEYAVDQVFTALAVPRPTLPGSALWFAATGVGYAYLEASDLIYTRSITCAYVACRCGMKTALELHSSPKDERPVVRHRFSRLLGTSRLALLVVISDSLRKSLAAQFGKISQPILVAHDGATEWAPTRGDAGRELEPDHFHAGYVGSLYPGKGVELLLQLAPLCPWATFHIIGGPQEQERYWRNQATGIANVQFHGLVPHREAQRFIAAMDVVLAPYQTRVEGIGGSTANIADWMSPLKIFEYMSHGKPIITSDLPVLREILSDAVTAMLCSPSDPSAWQAALLGLRQDDALRSRLGSNAKAQFLQYHTWDSRARKILAAIGAVG